MSRYYYPKRYQFTTPLPTIDTNGRPVNPDDVTASQHETPTIVMTHEAYEAWRKHFRESMAQAKAERENDPVIRRYRERMADWTKA